MGRQRYSSEFENESRLLKLRRYPVSLMPAYERWGTKTEPPPSSILHFPYWVDEEGVLVVYGTHVEDVAERRALENYVRKRYSTYETGTVDGKNIRDACPRLKELEIIVKPDREVTEAELRTRTVVLYGTPGGNAVLGRMSASLPIGVEEGAVVVDDRSYRGADYRVVLIAPNPLNPLKFLLVYTGSSEPAVIGANSLCPEEDSDFMLYKGVSPIEEGSFDKEDPVQWKLSEERKIFDMDTNWIQHESEHHVFFFRPDSHAQENILKIAELHESAFSMITRFLGMEKLEGKLFCHLYASSEDLNRDSGLDLRGKMDEYGDVHVVCSPDVRYVGAHEETHALQKYAFSWGSNPPRFLSEGMAEYLDFLFNDQDIHREALAIDPEARPAIREFLVEESFWKENSKVGYPLSGSFVQHLIEEYELEAVARLFKTLAQHQHIAEHHLEYFQEILGEPLLTIEEKWSKKLARLQSADQS